MSSEISEYLEWQRRRLNRRRFLGFGAAAAAAAIGGTIGASNRLEVTRSTSSAAFQHRPLRLAVLSDMHAPHTWVREDHLVKEVTRFDPDLVLVTGDAVDARGNEAKVGFYGRLPARLGRFACLGNWEYWGRCDLGRLQGHYESAGVRLLINESVRLDVEGEPMDVIGLEDLLGGNPNYGLVAQVRDAGRFEPPRAIVLSHCPVTFDSIVNVATRPTVVLSGHTHGGQVSVGNSQRYVPEGSGRYLQGWYTDAADMHRMYVSRGLGNSKVPLRLGARPELVLLTV